MLEILLIKSTTSVMGSDATLFVVCGCGWFLRFLTPQMFNALCRLGYDPCFKKTLQDCVFACKIARLSVMLSCLTVWPSKKGL